MRTIAITFAALFLFTIGAHADGTWCAHYSGKAGGLIAASTRFSNARPRAQEMADFASVTHSRPMRPNLKAVIGGTVRNSAASALLVAPSV